MSQSDPKPGQGMGMGMRPAGMPGPGMPGPGMAMPAPAMPPMPGGMGIPGPGMPANMPQNLLSMLGLAKPAQAMAAGAGPGAAAVGQAAAGEALAMGQRAVPTAAAMASGAFPHGDVDLRPLAAAINPPARSGIQRSLSGRRYYFLLPNADATPLLDAGFAQPTADPPPKKPG